MGSTEPIPWCALNRVGENSEPRVLSVGSVSVCPQHSLSWLL